MAKSKPRMNVIFYSHEVGAVSAVLTGKWSIVELSNALIKSVVFKDGIYEDQPGYAISKLQDSFRDRGYDPGVINQYELTPLECTMVMKGVPPNKLSTWALIEMPWADMIICGDTPSTHITKQKWVKDWCDGKH